jgi:hypothetical protein
VLGRVQDPEAVRPDEAHARGPADVDQPILELGAVWSGLGKPGRDHHKRRHPLVRALARDLDHRRGGDGDHGEIDLVRHLGDGRIGPYRLHDVGRGIDRVDDALEAGLQSVVEELAADRPVLARGADHGNRSGFEERADGGLRCDPVAILEMGHRLVGERGRQLNVDRARPRRHLGREAALAKDLDHPVVLRHDLRREHRDPIVLRDLGQMGE